MPSALGLVTALGPSQTSQTVKAGRSCGPISSFYRWSNRDKRGEGTCLRLHRLRHRREVVGRSAIFGGEHFVLEETDWYLLNLFRLWWHYGISFLRLQMWVEEVMEKFMR